MRRAALLAGLALASLAPAQAPAQTTQPGIETRYEELTIPLQALLDEGWEIVDMAGNLGGIAYLLRKESKWVTCQVVSRREDTRSRCMAMN